MPPNKLNVQSSGSIPPNSPRSTDEIIAHGEVKTQIAIVWVVGIILITLAIGGVISFFTNPSESKNLWVIIGPIISGSISGAFGFLAGKKQGSKKSR